MPKNLYLPLLFLLALVIAALSWHAHATVMAAGKGRIYAPEDVPPAETALVFGARVLEGGAVSWPLRWRLETAARLYHSGRVTRILVSGDNRREEYNEPLAMKQWLVENGVPENRIACDFAGRRTLDSCARAAGLWGMRDGVILVSQAYHLPRALFLAQAWGMNATAVAAEDGTYRKDRLRERLARVKAWLDVRVLGVEAAVWGEAEGWPE